MRLSLATKFLGAFVIVVIVAMMTVSFLANLSAEREVRGFMFRGSMTDAQGVATELAAFYQGRGSWDGVEALLRRARQLGGMGQHNVGPMMAMMRPDLTLTDSLGHVVHSTTADSGLLPDSLLKQATPIMVDDGVVGYVIVRAGTRLPGTQDLVLAVNRATWLAALVAGGAALILGGVLIVGLLRPVRALTAAARDLASGNLQRRVPITSRDELGDLSNAFNHMAEALERAERLRREMTADVAHELRNPLAVMQARVEAILDGVYASTPENLQAVLEQTRLLKRLVDDLSTLALADAGRLHVERKPTDVGELVRQVAEGYRLQADQAGIRLGMSVSLEGVAEARLDAARVEQILGNLVSNAIRHTPSGGDILVRVEQRSGTDRLVLEVLDSGEGIPPDSLPYVFERFYRADRGRGRHQGGTGLGLAIARKLAEAHGGTLEAANRPEGGARFTLSLPLAVPGAST